MSKDTKINNMLLITSAWGPSKSFALMPINNSCPYVECLYNPTAKTLAIIGNLKRETFHMIPRLDPNGEPELIKTTGKRKMQRVQQESYTEYYITERSEIENFIQMFAVNADTFDYKKILDLETMETENAMEGPKLILD